MHIAVAGFFGLLVVMLIAASIWGAVELDRFAQGLFSGMACALLLFAELLFTGDFFQGHKLAGLWVIHGFLMIAIALTIQALIPKGYMKL